MVPCCTFSHPTGRSETVGVRAIFIAPTKLCNFYRLRSSGDTPSVSHSLDSSLREGAGNGLCHSPGYSLKSGITGDFHRPYATQKILVFTIHRSTLPQSALRAASSLREGAGNGWCHSSDCSLNRGVSGDFHRPYETQKFLHSTIHRKNFL